MLILAEIKSHSGNSNYDARDLASQLRNSRRHSPRRQISPKDNSRELISIYFDNDDELMKTKTTTGATRTASMGISRPGRSINESITDRASQTFGIFSRGMAASGSSKDAFRLPTGNKSMTQGRQALVNQI